MVLRVKSERSALVWEHVEVLRQAARACVLASLGESFFGGCSPFSRKQGLSICGHGAPARAHAPPALPAQAEGVTVCCPPALRGCQQEPKILLATPLLSVQPQGSLSLGLGGSFWENMELWGG